MVPCCLLIISLLAGCTETGDDLNLTGKTMGTTWSARVADCGHADCAQLEDALNERLKELTDRLSHYDAESELTRFNTQTSTDWTAVSQDLLTVVEYALSVSELSEGRFDITIAPAVDAWGFGPAPTDLTMPPAETIELALRHSGYQKLAARSAPPALRKTDPLLRLDLSALAKGYAVDQLAYLIENAGGRNYMVEIGGEVRTRGVRPDGEPWRIGIQPPDASLAIEFVVTPGDAALATSGDYRNYYMLDDRRISHTIDPTSGTPVTNNLASVSVIAPDTMQADALATAIMVMGAEAGMEFARGNNIAVLIIQRTPDGTRASMSPEFEPTLL
jgi:thiamine biosynthesis lipoprotein